MSILVAREHMAMYQPKESQVREEQEARALASKRPHHLYDRFSQGIVSLDKLGEDSKVGAGQFLLQGRLKSDPLYFQKDRSGQHPLWNPLLLPVRHAPPLMSNA